MLAVENPNRISLFDGFTLDLARGCVTRSGKEIHLRPQTYEVLKCLVENRGHLISKDRLIEEVWKGRAVTDGSLGKCIEELRDALGPEAKQFIRNVRGRGYIFDTGVQEGAPSSALATQSQQIDVVRVTVEEHEEIVSSTAPKALPAIAPPRSGKLLRNVTLAVAAISVLVIAAFIGYRFFANRPSDSSPIKSIAVLPFTNETGNRDVEYLSDGVTESLINSLSQLPQLKVIARTSSFQYKGKEVNPQDVSRALGVHAIVLGHVVQHDDNLVVSVELMDARNNTQVWGERYTRKATDVQAVQEDIARTISEKLRLRLSGAQEQQLVKRATQNPQAYEAYLTGMYYYRKPGTEGVKKSLDYFNQAVALDPNFALAWIGLARANRFFAATALLNPKEPLAKAKAATEKALSLDETLPEAHLEVAITKKDEWDWAGAESEYKRAIELNPNLADAHAMYSTFLPLIGRHTEALAEIKRAQELDPLQLGLRAREVVILTIARRYDEAIEKQRQHIELEPGNGSSHVFLGLIYQAKGMYEQAINEYRKGMRIDGETTSVQCYLGYALAMSGKRREAQTILDKLKRTKEYVSLTELAYLYIGLGDNEAALASLERAYAARDPHLQNLKVDPHYDSLRSDPRFQDLLRRVGLPS
jgi:TolB-like protein/DNA-binding winged helix-turn-helix (wHTH) protein/Tfp pilus assembly protein PilF